MARVKFDENVPDPLAEILAKFGHDVALARDEGLAGGSDDALLVAASNEHRVLLTLDLDFADVVRHDPAGSPGVIVLRPHQSLLALILTVGRFAGALLDHEDVEGRLWIVDETRVRVWPGWPPA